MFKSVLLIGALGDLTFGQFVALELSKHRDSFSRLGLWHNTSRLTDYSKRARLEDLEKRGFEIVSAEDYASVDSYRGFNCVMIFLGNHALCLQPTIIDAAIEAGVRHFYPSEYGADILTGQNWTQRYYKYKVETREHLEAKSRQIQDLGWTYYLLGRLTEWSVVRHFGFDIPNARARIMGALAGRQSLINVNDSAKYLVETLKDSWNGGAEVDHTLSPLRRTYRVSGNTVTYGEIFKILERITGKPYQVTYLDLESANKEEAQAKAKGDVDAELSASHKLIREEREHYCRNPGTMVVSCTSISRELRKVYEPRLRLLDFGKCMA